MDTEQFAESLVHLQEDGKRYVLETDRDKSEEIGQEFASKLLSILEDHAKLTNEQQSTLIESLSGLLVLKNANDRPFLDVFLFDIFTYLVAFLDRPNTRQTCAKIIEEIAKICNPREVLMVVGEALANAHKAVVAKPLLNALLIVLERFPAASRSKFIGTSLPAVANLTLRRYESSLNAEQEGNEEEDEEEIEEGVTGESATKPSGEGEGEGKGKEKIGQGEGEASDDDDDEEKAPVQASVQLRNAFGDSEEDLEHKYNVSNEHLHLVSAVLDFVVALIPPDQAFQYYVMNEVGSQQRLLLKMLLHLMGDPLVQAYFGDFSTPKRATRTLEKPNECLQVATKIANVFEKLKVPAVFLLEYKKGKEVKIFGTNRAERKLKKKEKKRQRERRKRIQERRAKRKQEENEDDEGYEDYSTDEEYESNRRKKNREDFYWSEMGLGCYCYMLLVVENWRLPMVYSPIYTLFLSLPCISSLLRNPAPKASLKGLDLTKEMLLRVKLYREGSLEEEDITNSNSDLGIAYRLAEDLITFMVNCPDEERRQEAYKLLHEFLTLFGEEPRFKLLGELIRKCPYPAITGLLITRLKDEVQRAWLLPKGSSPFASRKLLDLFPFFMSFQGDILEKTDVLMNSLNFFRFLLLRDRGRHVLGVWLPDALSIVKDEFLNPLKAELGLKLDEYIHTLTSEEQHKKIELMTKHGFPKLTPQQMEQASSSTLTSLYMVKEIFDRIEEVIKEEEEKEKEKQEKEKEQEGK